MSTRTVYVRNVVNDLSATNANVLNPLDMAFVQDQTFLYNYLFNTSSDPAALPNTIVPQNPGTKRWLLQGINIASPLTMSDAKNVSHGMTTIAASAVFTYTFGALWEHSSTNGGLNVGGFTDVDDNALTLMGISGAATVTKAPILFIGGKKSGTTYGQLASGEPLMQVYSNSTPVLTIMGNNTATIGIGTATPGTGINLDVVGNIRASNQVTANASQGTIPLLITSNTMCNNLNADMVDGHHSSDFPTTSGGATGWMARYTSSSAFSASTILYSDGNNLALGANGASFTSPGYPLDIQVVKGQARIKSTTGTNVVNWIFTNTGGNMSVGMESSAGGVLLTGSNAYAGVIGISGNYALQFGTNNNMIMSLVGGNVGIGVAVPTSTVQLTGSEAVGYNTYTSNQTIAVTDRVVFSNNTSNNMQLTLPTAVGCPGRIYTIRNIAASNNTKLITTSNQTIQIAGNATIGNNTVLGPNSILTLISNNSNWVSI